MKKGIVFIGIAITVFGLTTYGYINERERANTCEVEEDVATCRVGPDDYYFGDFKPQVKNQSIEQELWYEVRGKYVLPTTKEYLKKAKLISDMIPHYPSKWIGSYKSVEIVALSNGKTVKASSPNDVLSKEQLTLLQEVDLSTDINVYVKYTTVNAITNETENEQFHVLMTVIPSKQANYKEGYDEMIAYLRSSSSDEVLAYLKNKNNKALDSETDRMYRPTVFFMVNEDGNIQDVRVTKTSGSDYVDQSIMNMIREMPKWNPAYNADGSSVKQNFEFSVGKAGC